mgnify:CR=1 FL=1
MKRRLRDLENPPQNRQQLQVVLVNIWNEIPQAFHGNLVRGMRRRINACIATRGGHTRYWLDFDFEWNMFWFWMKCEKTFWLCLVKSSVKLSPSLCNSNVNVNVLTNSKTTHFAAKQTLSVLFSNSKNTTRVFSLKLWVNQDTENIAFFCVLYRKY